ncbi:MAG TPA: diguanylate cyclase [Xanthobacteraceae bacterium]|jgi:diguanylate cyclase (GGDEF)-like protein
MHIEHFKTINDMHRHGEGDGLLRQFAARVGGRLRRGDTLARLGGDEFALVAQNLREPGTPTLSPEK